MKNEFSINKKKIWILGLLFLTVLATCLKITQGFDIDEGYALSMGLRLQMGDRFIYNLWDPYQFSALFIKPWIALFMAVKGNTDSLVLFTRLCSVFIQLLISGLVYQYFKRVTQNTFFSIILALCYFNFLPKQIQNIDHATTLVWCLTLFLLVFLQPIAKRKVLNLVLMGVFYCGMVLAYPTQLILFPFILVALYQTSEKKVSDCVVFSGVCCVIGCVTLLMVNPTILVQFVKYITMDGSHNFTISYHVSRIVRESIRLIIYVVPLVIGAIAVNKILKININFVNVCCTFCILWFGGIAAINVIGLPWPPLSMYCRYFVLTVMGFILIDKNERQLKWVYIISFLVMTICFFSSNTGIDAASGFIIFAALNAMLILFNKVTFEAVKKEQILGVLFITAILISQLLIKSNSVRITGTGFANRSSVVSHEHEVVRGINIQETQRQYYKDVDEILKNVEGNLIYCGTESISVFQDQIKLIVPTTTGTPDFNEQWVTYYQIHPFDQAYVLVKDENQYQFYTSNLWAYMEQNYDIEIHTETPMNSLLLLTKKD